MTTWGEGFHNYHHTFPYDYAISEMGLRFDPMKAFIDMMASYNQVWDRKRVSTAAVEMARQNNSERISDQKHKTKVESRTL